MGTLAEPISSPHGLLKKIQPFRNRSLLLLVLVMLAALIWRIDWSLILKDGLFSDRETLGLLDVVYVSESDLDLQQLKLELKPVRDRLHKFIEQPETIIFNKMHGFYEVLCIDKGKTVQFIYIHKSKLSLLSDDQLRRCVK